MTETGRSVSSGTTVVATRAGSMMSPEGVLRRATRSAPPPPPTRNRNTRMTTTTTMTPNSLGSCSRRTRGGVSNNGNSGGERNEDEEGEDDDCSCCFRPINNFKEWKDDPKATLSFLRRLNLFIGLVFFITHFVFLGLYIRENTDKFKQNQESIQGGDNSTTTNIFKCFNDSTSQNLSSIHYLADLGLGIYVNYTWTPSSVKCFILPNKLTSQHEFDLYMLVVSLIFLLSARFMNLKCQVMCILPWIAINYAYFIYYIAVIIDMTHGILFRGVDTILGRSMPTGYYSYVIIMALVFTYKFVYSMASKWLDAILDTMETNDTWYPKVSQFIIRYKKKIEHYKPYHFGVALMAIVIFIISFHNTVRITENDVIPISAYKTQKTFMPFNINNELYNCTSANYPENCQALINENWIHYVWLAVSSGLLLSMMISVKFLAYPWIALMTIYCISLVSKFAQILGFDKGDSLHVFGLEMQVLVLFLFYYLAAKLAVKTLESNEEDYEEVNHQEQQQQSTDVNTPNDSSVIV